MDNIHPPPKVSVCVITFNQVKYIRQCLQSIVDQDTNFDIEIIVGDDCSTDGTKEVVKEYADKYPKLIRPILLEKNVGGCENYLLVHRSARGEYVAHIDGDDAMLPNKLQQQADALDISTHCSAVFHLMEIIDDESKRSGELWLRKQYGGLFSAEDILLEHPNIGHSSLMYRRSCFSIFLNNCNSNFIDLHIYVALAGVGPMLPLNYVLGLYRRGVGVSSNENVLDLVFDVVDNFNVISGKKCSSNFLNQIGEKFSRNFAMGMLAKNNHLLFKKYWKKQEVYELKHSPLCVLIKVLTQSQMGFNIFRRFVDMYVGVRAVAFKYISYFSAGMRSR